MTTALSSYSSFTGYAKETTYGTGVTVTAFPPSTGIQFEDVMNYTSDSAMRGSRVDSYNQVPTQGWGTFNYGGPIFMDTIGGPLKGIFGAEDLSGAGPYVHKFGVLNSGTFQPPSYTLVDYVGNGANALQYPGAIYSQVDITLDPAGLLTSTQQGLCQHSAVIAKPSQSFSAKSALAGYTGAISIGGSVNTSVLSGTVTLTQQTNAIPVINNSSPPIWAGSVGVSGTLTILYIDDTIRLDMRNGTQVALDITYTSGADSLNLHATDTLFTANPIQRDNNGYMTQAVAFTAVANTTDIATAGGGYSPLAATLTNTVSTAY